MSRPPAKVKTWRHGNLRTSPRFIYGIFPMPTSTAIGML
jgi:hypothetical protein